MSGLDVEDLLRRTYADVAERTAVDPPSDATVVPLHGAGAGRPRRRAMLAAAAATIVLVAGGTALLMRSGTTDPAGVDTAALVHVLPSSLPGQGGGLTSGEPTSLPLVRLESSAERDIIEYAGDEDRLRIQVDRGDAVRPVEDPDTEFDGVPARLDADTGLRRITWNPRAGMQVTVEWNRGDVPMLLDIAEQLIFVDDATWQRATERAGFGPFVTSSPDAGVVAEYRLATAVPVTVEIQGWIHSGFMLRFPDASVSIPNIGQQCTASTGLVAGGPPGRVAVLTEQPGPVTVRRGTDGTVVAVVELTESIPGTDNYIEIVDVGASEGTTWGCEVGR